MALEASDWEAAQLEAQNQLTIWLSSNATAAYQSWNDRIARAKAAIVEPLTEPLAALQQSLGLPATLVDSARSNMSGRGNRRPRLPARVPLFILFPGAAAGLRGRGDCPVVGVDVGLKAACWRTE